MAGGESSMGLMGGRRPAQSAAQPCTTLLAAASPPKIGLKQASRAGRDLEEPRQLHRHGGCSSFTHRPGLLRPCGSSNWS